MFIVLLGGKARLLLNSGYTNARAEEDKGREAENSWPQCITSPQWSFQPFSLETTALACQQSSERVSHFTASQANSTTSNKLKTPDRSLIATLFPQNCLPLHVKSVSYTTDDIVACRINREDCLQQGTVYENHPVTMLTEWGEGPSHKPDHAIKGKDFRSSTETDNSALPHTRHHFRRHSICDSNPTHRQPHPTDCSLCQPEAAGSEAVFRSPAADSHAVVQCTASMSDVPQSSGSGQKSPGKGQGPTMDQLRAVETFFIESLPKFFKSRLQYHVYHPEIVFENNFWGENQVTVGLNQYAMQMMKLRALTHLRYAHVHMEVVSSACLLEEAVVRIHWRIVGLSQLKALRFWKYTAWSYSKSFREDAEWLDAISILHINKDGLVTKHRIDRMTPSEEGVAKAPSLAAKLALLFGLSAPKPSLSDFNSLLCRR